MLDQTHQEKMIIDLFAGGGGASTAMEMALGRSPDVAINHNADALALHQANHPDTLHLQSDIWDVHPLDVTQGRPVGLLWASPDCKHFSKAKGRAPKDRNIRDLAWNVVRWMRLTKPDVVCMENVEEFKTWGPICDEGRVIKGMEGVTYDDWVRQIKDLGYKIQWRELRGCDFGDPTIRKRYVMVARRDSLKITWPKPTHGAPTDKTVKSGKLQPFRTAAECIDWSLPCPSIFDTRNQIKEKHGLTAVRPLADATMARVARGLKRYVLDAETPFIVNLTHGARLESAGEPMRTITGANRGEKAVVAPTITKFNTGATGQSINAPLSTITANSYIKRPGGAAPIGLIAPHIMTMRNAQKPFNEATKPAHTICAGGAGLSIVAPHLLSLKGTARRDMPVTTPHPTVLAGGGHSTLVAPTLVQTGYGERQGQAPRALDIRSPLGTVVAGGIKHAHVATTLAPVLSYAQHGGNSRAITDPAHTICASRKDQNQLITPWFAKYYGTGDGARTNAPAHTITARDRFAHVQGNIDAPPFTEPQKARARKVAEFMRAQGVWDGGEFVTLAIDGETFVIVDIGLRMLTPRELFTAQGFPRDYVIEGIWTETDGDWTFKVFTKSTQVSCVGNSVCPGMAAAVISANCKHLMIKEMAA